MTRHFQMESVESQTVKYFGVAFEVVRGEDKWTAHCPFCEHTSEVETGFYPKLSMKLAAGWMRHHLESFHPASLT